MRGSADNNTKDSGAVLQPVQAPAHISDGFDSAGSSFALPFDPDRRERIGKHLVGRFGARSRRLHVD
jgi:hypothetical protein